MNQRMRLITFAILSFVVLSALLAWRKAPTASQAPAAWLKADSCRILGYPYAIPCGEIRVPLVHGQPGLGMRTLRWYRVPARARYPLPDPLIWIADGPGVNMQDRAAAIINTLKRIGNRRDILWLTPRGMPAKGEEACLLPNGPDFTIYLAPPRDSERCKAAWTEWGGVANLSAKARAADLVQLRQTLGLRQVNILAEGAGARVALAWMEREPEALRSMVWDSPPPLAAPRSPTLAKRSAHALAMAFAACAEEVRCATAYPAPASDLSQIRKLLPLTIALAHPQTGIKTSVYLTDDMLANLLARLLRSPARAAALPAALNAAMHGDWQPLFGLAALSWPRSQDTFGWALWLAEACLDESRLANAPKEPVAAWFFAAQQRYLAAACGEIAPLTSTPRHEIDFPVPTLVLTGQANPLGATPPSGVLAVEVPGAGHGVLAHDCAQDVVFRFLHAGRPLELAALDVDCLRQVAYPVPFVARAQQKPLP